METTIRISRNVKTQLDKMKLFERETYNNVIELLIEDHLELNEETKRNVEEARKRIKKSEFYTEEEASRILGF